MIETSRVFDCCSGTRTEIYALLAADRLVLCELMEIYKPGRIESRSSRNSSSQTIIIRISAP